MFQYQKIDIFDNFTKCLIVSLLNFQLESLLFGRCLSVVRTYFDKSVFIGRETRRPEAKSCNRPPPEGEKISLYLVLKAKDFRGAFGAEKIPYIPIFSVLLHSWDMIDLEMRFLAKNATFFLNGAFGAVFERVAPENSAMDPPERKVDPLGRW